MPVATISPQELAARIERGEAKEIIDVRTPAEFREIHATTARNVPLDTLVPDAVGTKNGEPLYFICKAGGRRSCGACTLRPGGSATGNGQVSSRDWPS